MGTDQGDGYSRGDGTMLPLYHDPPYTFRVVAANPPSSVFIGES